MLLDQSTNTTPKVMIFLQNVNEGKNNIFDETNHKIGNMASISFLSLYFSFL